MFIIRVIVVYKTPDIMRPYSVFVLLASVAGAPYEVTESAPLSGKLESQVHKKSVQCRTEYQVIWDTDYQVR